MEFMIIVLLCVMVVVYGLSAVNIWIKVRHFQFVGNTYVYVAISYLLCFCFALYANFNPAGGSSVNPLVAFSSSFFDALKMMVVAFDRGPINLYFSAGTLNAVFAASYIFCSIFALIFSSLSAILFVSKSFGAKIRNMVRMLNPNNEVYYILSDCRVTTAMRLAENLKKQNKIVVMFVSRGSLKTQEGTEYRDALINMCFDVRGENFSTGFCRILFRLFGGKRRVAVYAIFSDDELSIHLANNFKEAILMNKKFKAISDENHEITTDELAALKRYQVYVSYHEADIDLSHHYSETTLHIVNTLSEYDIISTEFIQHNQIINFLDIDDLKGEDNRGLNVTFLGFGKVNRPIFAKMTCAYQLWGDGTHKVHYHILDRDASMHVENANNEYTEKKSLEKGKFHTPYLYSVDGSGDGEDLTQYEAIDRHIRSIAEEGEGNHRFDPSGFEVFVVSIGNTNTDLSVGISLRKSLLKRFSRERLSKTVIFVRLGSRTLARHFRNDNTADGVRYVLTQEEFHDGYMNKADRVFLPLVVFGEHALMSDFIVNHYRVFDRLGIASQKSYYGSDMFRSEINWLHTKKAEVNANLATIYSMKTKMAALGYRLDDQYRICDKDMNPVDPNAYLEDIRTKIQSCGFPKTYDLKNPIIRVASIEHNRWVASSYQVFKYSPLPVEEFIAANTVDGVLTRKKGWTSVDGVKHVCMVDNASLMRLREEIVRANPALEEAANNLAFYTDLNMMMDICEALATLRSSEAN